MRQALLCAATAAALQAPANDLVLRLARGEQVERDLRRVSPPGHVDHTLHALSRVLKHMHFAWENRWQAHRRTRHCKAHAENWQKAEAPARRWPSRGRCHQFQIYVTSPL